MKAKLAWLVWRYECDVETSESPELLTYDPGRNYYAKVIPIVYFEVESEE